jgi:indole-3-glycerol phosphate synthase
MNMNCQCPLLCKEFVIDTCQIYNARVKGADAVLLIAAVLPDLDIKYMTKICKLLGMAALVEVCMVFPDLWEGILMQV